MIPSSSNADRRPDADRLPPRRALGVSAAVAVMALLAGGCTSAEPARFPTRSELPDDERRAAGIAVDLSSAPPPARDQAETRDAVVALRAPLGLSAAFDVVGEFFEAVYAEDMSALSDLVRPKTQIEDTRAGSSTKSHMATNLWRHRFQKRDYQALTGQLVFRRGDIATFRGNELDALPLSVRYLAHGEEALPNDVVLQVPIVTHTVANERLFGDEVFFWLRRRGSRYVIVRMAEEVPF